MDEPRPKPAPRPMELISAEHTVTLAEQLERQIRTRYPQATVANSIAASLAMVTRALRDDVARQLGPVA